MIQVIFTEGSDYDIGYQHAEQLGKSVFDGMVSFYHEFWKQLLDTRPSSIPKRFALQGLKFLVDPILTGVLRSGVPAFAFDRLNGLADVTALNKDELALTLILPDLFPMLQAYYVRLMPKHFIAPVVPRFGCSSFLYRGDKFFHGRNLDFPGVNYWDKYPVIQLIKKKHALKYIAFTTAGVPFGGITGINEAQIGVSLHQHYGRNTFLKGTLPFLVAEKVLSEAATLEAAEEIICSHSVSTAWTFIVYDGKKRDGFFLERHAKACGVKRFADAEIAMSHSNYFQTPECKEFEYATTARMNWDNYFRRSRLQDLLEGEEHSLTVDKAIAFLGDHFDPFWGEEKILNRIVSQTYNIQSLVVDPVHMKAWMAGGPYPNHLHPYYEFDLGQILEGHHLGPKKEFQPNRFKDDKKRRAKEVYMKSFVAAFDGDWEHALKDLEGSLDFDFCPEVAQIAGIVAMKMGEEHASRIFLEKAKEAIERKVREKGTNKFPPEYFEICIYLARNFDLLDKREPALKLYQFVLAHPNLEDDNLRRIAKRAKVYKREHLESQVMPYSSYIPFV